MHLEWADHKRTALSKCSYLAPTCRSARPSVTEHNPPPPQHHHRCAVVQALWPWGCGRYSTQFYKPRPPCQRVIFFPGICQDWIWKLKLIIIKTIKKNNLLCCFINYCGHSAKVISQRKLSSFISQQTCSTLYELGLSQPRSSFKADMLLGFVLKPVQHYILLKWKRGWITCSARRVRTVLDVSTDVNTVWLHGDLQQWLIFPGSLLCKHCLNSNS